MNRLIKRKFNPIDSVFFLTLTQYTRLYSSDFFKFNYRPFPYYFQIYALYLVENSYAIVN